ncbi:MAG: AI-2E family transporter [Pyrinomonadaceae bacterium]
MTKILVRLLFFLAVIVILKGFAFIIVPITVAGILAILIHPWAKRIENRFGLGKVPAGLIVVLTLVIALIFLSVFIGSDIARLVSNAPQYSANLISKLNGLTQSVQSILPDQIQRSIVAGYDFDKLVQQSFQALIGVLGSVIGSSAGVLSVMLVFPLYIFFILIYREYLIEFLIRLFKSAPREKIHSIVIGVYEVAHKYIRGVLTVMLIVGTLNSLGLWALGIPSPFFFGFFAALLTIVPYVGVFVGSIIPITVAFITKDSLWYPFACLVLFMVVQFLEGNFITPNITGAGVSLNPFAGIASLVFFGWLWGTPGFIIAYPMTAISKVIFDNIDDLKPFGFLLSDFNAEPKTKELVSEDIDELKEKSKKMIRVEEKKEDDEAE